MSLRPALIAGASLLAAGGGLMALEGYKSAPGEPGVAVERWPAGTALALDPAKPTLLVFAHPRCPCTEATISELRDLVAESKGRIVPTVVFYRPEGSPEAWSRTKLWERAAEEIPGVRLVSDEAGAEARLFGALTSGVTAFYRPGGELAFRGGLTATRGHVGYSEGRRTIASIASIANGAGGEGAELARRTRVFGCSLFSAKERQRYGLASH